MLVKIYVGVSSTWALAWYISPGVPWTSQCYLLQQYMLADCSMQGLSGRRMSSANTWYWHSAARNSGDGGVWWPLVLLVYEGLWGWQPGSGQSCTSSLLWTVISFPVVSTSSLCQHVCHTTRVVISLSYKPGCSSLDYFHLVDLCLGVRIPHCTGIVQAWSDQGFVCCLLDILGSHMEILMDKVPGVSCLICSQIDLFCPCQLSSISTPK